MVVLSSTFFYLNNNIRFTQGLFFFSFNSTTTTSSLEDVVDSIVSAKTTFPLQILDTYLLRARCEREKRGSKKGIISR